MFIDSLALKNFRNYENLDIRFSENINILYGDNAQGKTNILGPFTLLQRLSPTEVRRIKIS